MRIQFCFAIWLCIIANIIQADETDSRVSTDTKDDNLREKKLLSLFSIVTFPNQGCASQDPGRNGTCYTTTECQDKGGTKSGNCAAGFGVCCLFIVSSAATTINENCTYIQNPDFPSGYTGTSSLTYTINKCSADVCNVRLDFETFTTAGPTSTAEVTGGVCTDSFVASGTSGFTTPVICGSNTGQHIYVEMGNSGSSDTATLAFSFSGTTQRTWELKATQIPCSSSYKPPEGCLQYHTTLTGRFQTFNFAETTTPQHLASQNYGICIRQEDGYCCVEYAPCADANSYSLSHTHATNAKQDNDCAGDYVGIEGVTDTCNRGSGADLANRLCGATNILNTYKDAIKTTSSVCDCVPPFVVNIRTDNAAAPDIAGQVQRGVCFDYKQIPC